jgi:nitrite reductase/ring-hydroxylating ferredoxin subunit
MGEAAAHRGRGEAQLMNAGVTTEREVALPLSGLPPGTSTTVNKGLRHHGGDIQRRGEQLFALSNHCPHHGGPLCRGRISGTALPSEPYEYRYGREGRMKSTSRGSVAAKVHP